MKIDILKIKIFSNYLLNYLLSFLVFLFSYLFLKFLKNRGIKKIESFFKKRDLKYIKFSVELLNCIGWPFYFFLSIWLSSRFLLLPENISQGLNFALLITFLFYLIKIFQKLIDFGLEEILEKRKEISKSVLDLLGKFLKAVVWVSAILFLLQNLGFQITTLIAGLGIGGIAIAFALQTILQDLFACFSIYFDRPFEVGDFIEIGGKRGEVEKIGIKSTRIRSISGEEIIIPNKTLVENEIFNYRKMERRRIIFNFGVIYETENEKLKKIPQIVKEIIESIEDAEFQWCHFKEFGDFSLNFVVSYLVKKREYQRFLEIQEEINLKLKERFEKEKIEFAYPTYTVFKK